MRIVTLAVLLMLLAQPIVPSNKPAPSSPLRLTLTLDKLASTESVTFSRFICILENTGKQTLRLVAPTAFSIEPHPWIQKDAFGERRFWPGSEICAPYFTKDDLVELRPGEKREYQLPWGTVVTYKSQQAVLRKVSVGYSFKRKGTRLTKPIDFVSLGKLTEIDSVWSNEIEVPTSH